MLSRLISFFFLPLLLAGCAAGPGSKAVLHVLNDEGDAAQRDAVVYSFIPADEVFADHYPFRWRNVIYLDNVEYSSEKRAYRLVPVVSYRYSNVKVLIMSGAFVPDYLPILKEGDVVEVSQRAPVYRANETPDTGRDSPVVVRVVCFNGSPTYQKCIESLTGSTNSYVKARNLGARPVDGAPFIEGPERYGLVFSRRYDEKTGEVLPTAKAIPSRDSFTVSHLK